MQSTFKPHQLLDNCPTNCTVQSLSQLLVCQLNSCTEPLIRCKDCFRKLHISFDEQGKKQTHLNRKFNQSSLYKNFYFLIKIYEIIVKKINREFGRININGEYLGFQIFAGLDFKSQILDKEQFIPEFYLFKQLYYQRTVQFGSSPSAQFATNLQLFTEKMFNSIKLELIQPTPQQTLMSLYFNQTSRSSPQALHKFIIEQQQLFTKYCDEVREKGNDFYIELYIKQRGKIDEKDLDYFSLAFENFMVEKYSEKPSEQSLFTVSEYVSYVWSNLQSISLNPQVQSYINSWVDSYTQYSEFMRNKNLQPSLLAFRMWKQTIPTDHIPTIVSQNQYFLDNFALAYIDVLINNLYDVIPIQAKTWKQFMKYIKDYEQITKLKSEQFTDITKYAIYYDFRHRNQRMVQQIEKSQNISIDRSFFVQYLNQSYKSGTQVSIKAYEKLLALKDEQKQKQQTKLLETSKLLQEQVEKQEGNKFYRIVFNDYLKVCLKDNEMPNKQKYFQFKKNLLEEVDEEGIILENDKLLLQAKQPKQIPEESKEIQQIKPKQQSQKQSNENKQNTGQVKYNIDQAQENFVEFQQKQEQSEQDDSTDPNCPCCNGHPEQCTQPECQMMGYCVTCSL